MATDGTSSYVLITYGRVDPEIDAPTAVASAADGEALLGVNPSDATVLQEDSNVGVPGLYVFQVNPERIVDFGMCQYSNWHK